MNILLEKGYARLMQVMSGLVPNVRTLGIVTWENPMGKSIPSDENNRRNIKLQDTLKRGAFSYRHIKGKYGAFEHPYLIHNVKRSDIIELGKLGKQESVIYAYHNEKGEMVFDLIDCDSGNVVSSRRVWKGLNKGEVDYFSEYKGRKFVIPFFDEDSVDKHLERGRWVSDNEHNVYSESKYPRELIEKVNKTYLKNNGSYTSRIAAFELLYRYEKEKNSQG